MEWQRIIMLLLGIAVLCAFFPFSVISFHIIQSLNLESRNELLQLLPVIAFFTVIFPQRAMQYIQEKLLIFRRLEKRPHELSLDMIEGMNLFNKVRLAEVGIDNAQNLAEANLEELILKTPFNPALLVDWIARAKLFVVFKDQIAKLRRARVRTVLNLRAACGENLLSTLAKLSEMSVE